MELQTLATFSILLIATTLLPPLLDGIERKIRARIHSRIGPPTIMQTWYDILKLFSKEIKIPRGAEATLVTIAISFVMVVCLAIVTSFTISLALLTPYVVALLLIFKTSLHTLIMIAASTTSNPFALIGSTRLATLVAINELGILASVCLTMYALHQLSYDTTSPILLAISVVMLIVAIYVASGRLPYDIYEAEPELAAGALIEFSGPLLGAYIYVHLAERFLLNCFASYLILYTLLSQTGILLGIAVISMAVLLWIVFTVISTVLGRTRVDLCLKFLSLFYTSLISVWVIAWLV